jgi:hypothetical protein
MNNKKCYTTVKTVTRYVMMLSPDCWSRRLASRARTGTRRSSRRCSWRATRRGSCASWCDRSRGSLWTKQNDFCSLRHHFLRHCVPCVVTYVPCVIIFLASLFLFLGDGTKIMTETVFFFIGGWSFASTYFRGIFPDLHFLIPRYTLAGFDLTTHNYNFLGGRPRRHGFPDSHWQ